MSIEDNPLVSSDVDKPADEKLIWEGCPKWQADFMFIVKSGLVFITGWVIMGLLIAYTQWHWIIRFLIPFIVSLTGVGMFGWVRLKRKNERYKITTLNLEYELGVFSKTVHNLEMWRIRDIVFMQSLFDRMLGISRIKLITNDPSTPELILEGLPPGRRIYEDIKQAFLLARQRRNIIGMVD
ncbi:MAG: PH domain-containing protein [Deltaproteobacteria bacterium]|nr:PH domain-containing protein [Deltaproteobacteria bacterium]